jgi:serine/threonine protein kinase
MKEVALQVRLPNIGGYHLVEQVARTDMGAVYKAINPLNGQFVAVKMLPPEATEDEVLRLRFAKECQVAQRLRHPDIVHVLDYGLEGMRPFMVMEFVDGESLGDRLEREGRLPEAEALRIIRQVGLALHWAHERRVIHRDVKPDNILLTADGRAKLADLGLVKSADSDFNITRSLSGLGTPNFMAPEQFSDAKHADARSDLYSLAATLYQTVTGELPFRARSHRAVATILRMKMADDIASPRRLVPELSERLDREVMRALRADRKQRHATVRELLDALLEGGAVAAEAAEAPPPAPAAARPARKDNRRKVRFPVGHCASCQPYQRIKDDHTWGGQLVNLSETGLCMELGRRFEPGALLTLTFTGLDAPPRLLLGRVVWVERQEQDRWRLGCCFDRPLGEVEVRALLSSAPLPAPAFEVG